MPNYAKLAEEIASLIEKGTLAVRRSRSARLPMDDASRMARADAMFPVDAYHGTGNLDQILRSKQFKEHPLVVDDDNPYIYFPEDDTHTAGWFSTSPATSYTYAAPPSAGILPVRLNPGNSLVVDAKGLHWNEIPFSSIMKADPSLRSSLEVIQEARRELNGSTERFRDAVAATPQIAAIAAHGGYDSATVHNVIDLAKIDDGAIPDPSTIFAMFRPKDIRSRSAAFDPAKRDSPNLLDAVIPALPVGALTATQQDNPSKVMK